MRGLFVAFAVCATASCSLFTSLGDFSSGEGASDGGTTEGGSGLDGSSSGGEGGADGGADSGRICQTANATFCDDFDDPTDTMFKKWFVETQLTGKVSKATEGFSAPSALEASVKGSGDNQIPARLYTSFSVAKRARLFYRFKLLETESLAFAQFGQLEMVTPGGEKSSFRLTMSNGGGHFEGAVYKVVGQNGTFPKATAEFKIPPNVWHSVDLTVDWEAIPATATVDFDGSRLADKRVLDGSTFGGGQLTVTAGFYYLEGGDTPWRVLVDDVAIWVE